MENLSELRSRLKELKKMRSENRKSQEMVSFYDSARSDFGMMLRMHDKSSMLYQKGNEIDEEIESIQSKIAAIEADMARQMQ